MVISVIALLLCFGILLSPTGANAGAGGVLTAQRDSRSADLEAHMAATDDTPADIDAELLTDVAGSDETASPDSASGPVEIVVRFADPGVPSAAAGDPEAAVAALQSLEQQRWDLVEEGLRALDDRVTVLNRFWITGAILVSATPSEEVLSDLAALPGAVEVVPNFTVEPTADVIGPGSPGETVDDPTHGTLTWGVDRIEAPQAWDDFGVTGEGVRVAVLDTGVDASHPDLADKMVGADLNDPTYPGGWITFDSHGLPIATTPADPGSHGTHVAGTIVGGDASEVQIGVAPGASLMAANVLSGAGGGSYARILAGLQWALAPHSGHSTDDRVGLPANVINMSLGSTGHSAAFADIIRNIRAAGIFPAIAIGNAPCGPTGNSSPGDLYEAVGVGNTNSADEVNPESCGAQTAWPAEVTERYDWPQNFMKPDVSAPGTAVYSAIPGGRWGQSTGTSMATPHVAGAAALIASARAGLSVDEIAQALEDTAWHPAGDDAEQDDRYGHGRINVHDAIASVLGASGVSGTVIDSATGAPIEGALVTYADVSESWTTDARGAFQAPLVPGKYTLRIQAFGYHETEVAVTVPDDRIVQAQAELEAMTTGVIQGVAVSRETNEPIEGATVVVVGQPLSTTTASDGSYRFEGLPPGQYTVAFSAEGMTTATAAPARVEVAHQTTVNAVLSPQLRVLLIGSGDADRTAELLRANETTVTQRPDLPASVDADEFDTVIVDTAAQADPAAIAALRQSLQASGVGSLWLDLGSNETTGIALLSHHTGSPVVREGANDRDATATGYVITAEHPIFAAGQLSNSALTPEMFVSQNSQSTGPKFTAWFSDFNEPGAQVLASAAKQNNDGSVTVLGDGIAVSDGSGSRTVLLSLHASMSAIGARTWSSEVSQVLVNSTQWAAPDSVQPIAPTVLEPQSIKPTPPDPDDDGDGDGDGNGHGGNNGNSGGSPWQPAPANGNRDSTPQQLAPNQQKTPTAQEQPKPESAPGPPFSSLAELKLAEQGGITAVLDGDELAVTIPGAEPGDWYYLHIYPHKLGVDWIRVNSDGELRINIGSLQGGTYYLVFTAADGAHAGWYELEIAGEDEAAPQDDVPAAELPDVQADLTGDDEDLSAAPDNGLTPLEQGLLLGTTGVLLAAAAVITLAALRRKPSA
ncbi:S8 family serine peptidase [Agrococcus casei]|uniref:S8 family serine peptidase n=1 Tax=Agrococcus casei TaxID=343512 RepID=UPI001356480C|nr:S8 family serine peptidase [Agrococcus casei]